MSEFHVRRVTLDVIKPHPDADRLNVAYLGLYPCVIGKDQFSPGDEAVYIPVDAIVDCTRPEFEFMAQMDMSQADKDAGKRHATRRIKAKKLRGVFSMGLLIPYKPEYALREAAGDTLQDILGIVKWEPVAELTMGGDRAIAPVGVPSYTDIEGYRAHPNVFAEGELVVVTEKIHGANARFVYTGGELHVGSMNNWWKESDTNIWWKAAKSIDLVTKLANYPDMVLYGEVYGRVQDLRYDMPNDVSVRFFDVYDISIGRYLDYDAFIEFVAKVMGTLDVARYTVPVIYKGAYTHSMVELAEGASTLASHTREGVVVKPLIERFCEELGGRAILKYIGEGYLTRKGA